MSTEQQAPNLPTPETDLSYRLTSEQQDMQQTFRRFLQDRAPLDRVRATFESATEFDRQLWDRLTTELGLPALTLPEHVGGDGMGMVEMSIVMHELGRSLAPTPYFATVVLAASALLAAGGDVADALLRGIARGDTATLAFSEGQRTPTLTPLRTTASHDGRTWRLTGEKTFVLDAATATTVLLFATYGDMPSLFAINTADPGVNITRLQTLDMSRPQGRIILTAAPAQLIGQAGDARRIFDETLRTARVALSAEQIGGAERCLEMAVDYAKTRIQFNRPIGSFQAVKHKCAELFVAVELARTASSRAAQLLAAAAPEQDSAAATAAALCAETFAQMATENIHIHGGMGFTWEHDAHLYYRRAKASEVLLGGPRHARALLLESLGV